MVDQMHEACAELRFAEGLRRRSAEARAEATIREACALAALEGSRVPPSQVRDLLMVFSDGAANESELPGDAAVTLGAWRATWSVVSSLPGLNERAAVARNRPPLRSVLAGMQRDYCSFQVAKGMIPPAQVAIPVNPSRWARTIGQLEQARGTALERAASAWALLATDPPFAHGSQVMGPLLAKLILAEEGVEPTAVAVISLLMVENQAAYQAALAGAFGQGHGEWVDYVARSVVRGCEVGQAIAREVQAARLA